MESQYEQSGAKKVFATWFNHTYANVIAQLGAAQIGIANNLKALVFFDNNGDEQKTMQDASGASTIPENSVVIANSDGQATSDTDFTFDPSAVPNLLKLPIPCTIGVGDQDTNGSLRIRMSTEGFFFEQRILGSWETLGDFVP